MSNNDKQSSLHPDSKTGNALLKFIARKAADEHEEIIKKATEHAFSLLHESKRPVTNATFPSDKLPSAEIAFKEILQNQTAGATHPNEISSLVYSFASLIDLSVRRPGNVTSANFDLYPLYGGTPSEYDQIRLKDGSGMLSPDCFFDDRLTLLPRASAVLLILFNRNHNYIARRLLLQGEISAQMMDPNNGGSNGAPSSPQFTNLQDEKLFEAARLINCAHFRNILLEDVLKPLAGMPIVGPSYNPAWISEAKGPEPGGGKFKPFTESALLYDWSAIMSENDIEYVEGSMRDIFDEDPDKVTLSTFDHGMEDFAATLNANKRNRNYAGLRRGQDGRFLDADLAQILYDATEFPARKSDQGIPPCQQIMQIKTIEWARNSNACSLNEYRKYLGLKALTNFEEWAPNKAVATAAENLYKSIDNLEVYVGLQAENTFRNGGLQLGYTKTFGLLVDIISRIRSDPALNTDISAKKLTQWGYNDCSPRPINGSLGASMPKLLQRTLPREYAYNNIYGLFPLSVPRHTGSVLSNSEFRKLKLPGLEYDTKRPQPPKVHHLVTKKAISYVCNKPKLFPTTYDENLSAFTGGYGYLLGFDDEKRHDADQAMSLHALIPDSGALERYAASFAKMAHECIEEIMDKSKDPEIDVARDVINAVCTRWVCDTLLDYDLQQASRKEITDPFARYPWLSLFLPLLKKVFAAVLHKYPNFHVKIAILMHKIGLEPGKPMTPSLNAEEIHARFATLYASVFHNVDPEDEWQLRENALRVSKVVSQHIESRLPPPTRVTVVGSYLYFLVVECFWHTISMFFTKLGRELTIGTHLQGETAQTFLDRVVNTDQSIPGIPLPRRPDESEVLTQNRPKNTRVVANVLGLAVVAAVKYAKVCTQAVDFYLQDQYAEERKEIIRLSQLNDKDSRKLLMGYIREAFRLNHPLGVWRYVSESADIPQGLGLPDIKVKKGDKLYVNFSKALTANDPADENLQDPLKVNPMRQTNEIQGVGLHRCPGISFVDETVPEIFQAIFQLPNVRRAPGRKGNLVQFTAHPDPQDTDPKSFLDAQGRLEPFPQSLVLQYDRDKATEAMSSSKKREQMWKVSPGKNNPERLSIKNRVLSVILILILTCFASVLLYGFFRIAIAVFIQFFRLIIYILLHLAPLLIWPAPLLTRPAPQAAPPAPTSNTPVACLPPTTSIQPWEITTMKAGGDGKLIPLEYTLDHPKAHSLSIVDVDAKDMTMSIWLDNNLLGATRDVELNKSDNCGDDFGDCLRREFSGGYVVIPKGKHTVRVQWAGIEKLGPDGKVDWGEEGGRRLAWSRDLCAA